MNALAQRLVVWLTRPALRVVVATLFTLVAARIGTWTLFASLVWLWDQLGPWLKRWCQWIVTALVTAVIMAALFESVLYEKALLDDTLDLMNTLGGVGTDAAHAMARGARAAGRVLHDAAVAAGAWGCRTWPTAWPPGWCAAPASAWPDIDPNDPDWVDTFETARRHQKHGHGLVL